MVKFYKRLWILIALAGVCGSAWAVKTTTVVQSSEKQFKDGQTTGTMVSSEGKISLARQCDSLLTPDPNTWLINAVVADKTGVLYAATSGTGAIYRMGTDKSAKVIYGQGADDQKHVFSLGLDSQGRLLAGTGGQAGLLLRFNTDGNSQKLFSQDEIKYIWSLVVDSSSGRIYLGTGPTGKVFSLDAEGANPEVICQTKENNILSLALDAKGILFAGGDKYGMVYRIDPVAKTSTVAYDAEQQEISSLVFDKVGNLYIATGDAKAARRLSRMTLSNGEAGRPEIPPGKGKAKEIPAPPDVKPDKPSVSNPQKAFEEGVGDEGDGGDDGELTPPMSSPASEPLSESLSDGDAAGDQDPSLSLFGRGGNYVYKMTPGGFVTAIFNQPIVILAMAINPTNNHLVLGTANEGQVLQLDAEKEESAILHSAKPSGQVSAVCIDSAGVIYAGLANPAGLIAIAPSYAKTGEFVSDKIDAQQVSGWGRLVLDTKIPEGSRLTVSTRTGNTRNSDDGPWGEWSSPVELTSPMAVVPIQSAVGRFLQYKLNFESPAGQTTAEVSQVGVSYMIPNLPPKIRSVTLEPAAKKGPKPKSQEPTSFAGSVKLAWKADDPNKDRLIAAIYLRPVGGQRWVRIAKDIKAPTYTFNSLTAADGRYEFKVEVSDLSDNTPEQALTDSRISRCVVLDNTPPEIRELTPSLADSTLTVHAQVIDSLSPVGEVMYCVDGEEPWRTVLPVDDIFDDLKETVEFKIEIAQPGEHLLAISFADALGNKTYRNLTVNIKSHNPD